MEEKTFLINADQLKRLAHSSAVAAIKLFEQEREKENVKTQDRRFHNTKLLLQNYRDFKICADEAIYSAEQANDTIEILDLMWDPHNRSDQFVESIKRSSVRTKIMVLHLDSMILAYEQIVAQSKNPSETRRFGTMYDKYIAENELSFDEIAKKYAIDVRTVYGDIKYATERMAKLIFGIDFISNVNIKEPSETS
jgi:hypothetical protein